MPRSPAFLGLAVFPGSRSALRELSPDLQARKFAAGRTPFPIRPLHRRMIARVAG